MGLLCVCFLLGGFVGGNDRLRKRDKGERERERGRIKNKNKKNI